jgi:hypothetical protein
MNPSPVKFQRLAAVVAGASKFASIVSDEPLQIVRLFNTISPAGGAPGPDTLPALTNQNLYQGSDEYDVPDLYLDSVNSVLYVCIVSGTTATSSWKQISGAGGGAAQLWVPGTVAGNGSLWVLQSGPAMGLYMSTAAGNNNSPDTGINWVQLGGVLNVWQ